MGDGSRSQQGAREPSEEKAPGWLREGQSMWVEL